MESVESPKEIAEFEISKLQAERRERASHVNAALRAIRSAYRIIVREKDRDRLVKGICERLIQTPGLYYAWIALLDESGGLLTTAQAGLGKEFLPVVEKLKVGDLTKCGLRALADSEVVATEGSFPACTGCPLLALCNGRGTITAPLLYDERVYGLFYVCVARDFLSNGEGQALFGELASDIASALHSIQLEEERRRLESQLKYAQRMKALGTLAGGIAHNFNNLFMVIEGNVSLMLLETDPDHPSYGRLRKVEKSVQRGARLTSQLLGYARQGSYEVKVIGLNEIVEGTSRGFSVTKKEITIHRDLDGELFAIKADKRQVQEVLLSLFANAADAMPGGGDLFLKTMNIRSTDIRGKPYRVRPGDYVLLTVTDTGTGMDEETMERIFEPFFSTKGMSRGNGLGLAAAYGIIKAHGGYIDVESEKGRGSAFSVYLPAAEEK